MLNFRTAYLQAMRDQAPEMFRELRSQQGALEAHLDAKQAEAQAMFRELTKGAKTLPSGALADPSLESRATEQVFSTLIEFPPPNSTPEEKPEGPEPLPKE